MAKKKTNSTPQASKQAKQSTRLSTLHDGLVKPNKPAEDFPLYPHNRGYWAKKINKKVYYFGKWDDPDAALAEFNRVQECLYAGRTPPPKMASYTPEGELSLKLAINMFLNHKKADVDTGEINKESWKAYTANGREIQNCLGEDTSIESLTSEHFSKLRVHLCQGRSVITQRNKITLAIALFRWLVDADKVDKLPYKLALKKPSDKSVRKEPNSKERKLLTPAVIKRLIAKANGFMKPAILLAANCGLGNRDVIELRWTNVRGGWLTYPRRKTGVERRAKLWDETLAALNEWKKESPKSEFVCCGQQGQALGSKGAATPIAHLFEAIAKEAKVDLPKGHGFYVIRHSYRTAVDRHPDLPAIRMTMGHDDHSIDSRYREGIDDDRLEAVAAIAHHWLFGA